MTQIWIVLCVYLLLSYIKFKAKIGWTVLQLTLFKRGDLLDLSQKKPPNLHLSIPPLHLFKNL